MDAAGVLEYVRATAPLLGLPLGPDRAEAVALHLQRTAAIAQLLDGEPAVLEIVPPEMFMAAPFPPEESA